LNRDQWKDKLATIPDLPGSYQFKNDQGVIIYVGKAKSLKKRVSSYFTGSHDAKTARLVMNIADIEYIVTSSELDALLLELNLIKKYNPRYNIMLTDDKTYPYIEITNETHPKLVVTRNVKKKSKLLFGPYPNVKAARDTVKLLNKIYPLRKCDQLPKQACLYYHMGQCLAPCIHNVTQDQYADIIKDIKAFLKGDIKDTIRKLEGFMMAASENMEYERANEYKKTIEAIQTTTDRQKINLNDRMDRDVIGYHYDDHLLSIEIFFLRNGKISARHQKLFEYYDDPVKTVENYLAQFYEKEVVPAELFVPLDIDAALLAEYLNTKVHQPQRGDKKRLLELATLNAKQSLSEKTELVKRDKERTIGAIERLGEHLGIPTPHHIEAFDNSNLFGTNAVSAMVVFLHGRPAKQQYRKFKVKTMNDKASDYHTMQEILYRRYQRVLMEDLPRPDLILVDGGKPQINAAKDILGSLGLDDIPLAGLVKDETHSTSTLMDGSLQEIPIKRTSDVFHLLTRIQDEAHRFAIEFHRQVRSKGLFHSALDDIPGIGDKTKAKLLQQYKSVQKIKLAPLEDLLELGLTRKQADALIDALQDT
jgi:excinuclease ABC subunit C